MLVGNRPRTLLLGFMGVTFCLSMWMSNTSTTGIMTPLVITVLDQLQDKEESDSAGSHSTRGAVECNSESTSLLTKESTQEEAETADVSHSASVGDTETTEGVAVELQEISLHQTSEETANKAYRKVLLQKFSIAMLLAVAYCASLGGTATIIGTGMQILFADDTERFKVPTWSSSIN